MDPFLFRFFFHVRMLLLQGCQVYPFPIHPHLGMLGCFGIVGYQNLGVAVAAQAFLVGSQSVFYFVHESAFGHQGDQLGNAGEAHEPEQR